MVYQTARMQGSSAVFYRRAKALAKVLVKHGAEVLIVVPSGEADAEPLLADARCRIQEVELCSSVRRSSGIIRSWLALPASSARLAAIGRDFGPDAVIVSTHDPFMQIEALRAARAANALLVAHVPDSWYLLRRFRRERVSPWVKMLLEGWVLRRADRVLCVTETHRQLVRDGYGLRDDRAVILRNGIDLAEWPVSDPPKTADLLHIGPIRVYYDDSLLLRGLARLCERRPQTTVRFLGVPDGKLAAEQLALAGRLNLADRLDVQGLVPPDEVARLGAAARLGIVAPPEGMESAVFVKLYEYLAMGLPAIVLGNSEGENARLVQEHDVGLVCPDEEAFAEQVGDLLSDPDQLQELSARARRTAALYDYDRTISEWYESDLAPLMGRRRLHRDAPPPRT